jgi:transcriptional regulator with XRE-family HTH domain
MSYRRTTGSLVLAGREAKGLSLRRAARRLGVSPRALRNWERGRESIPFAARQAMVTLYDIAPELLTPARPTAGARHGNNGTIRIGSVTFTAHEGDDDSLRAFLAAVRRERGLAPGAELAVRASDAELLADLLGGSAESILANLQRLLGISETEAAELSRWMFRRTAVAGALAIGLVAGAVATGALSPNPPAAGAGQASAVEAPAGDTVAPPADPNWAVIGDAAVLYREGVPHN